MLGEAGGERVRSWAEAAREKEEEQAEAAAGAEPLSPSGRGSA